MPHSPRPPCARAPLALLLPLLLTACGDEPLRAPEAPGGVVDTAAMLPPALSGETADPDKKRPPLVATDLTPVLATLGEPGVAPTELRIELARRVLDAEKLGEGAEQTRLVFTPDLPGHLSFVSPSTLRFQPSQALEPDTTYRVSLEAIATRDGVLEAPDEQAWTSSFRTPRFAFHSMRLVSFDAGDARRNRPPTANLEVAFTGPVTSAEVRPRAQVLVRGGASGDLAWEGTERNNVLSLRVRDNALRDGAPIKLVLEEGAASARGGQARAPGASSTVTIGGQGAVSVLRIRVGEGTDGHHVDVICDDDAVKGGDSWWYDDVTYDWFEISRRCLPDETAKEHITIDPPVEFAVVPARRGFRLLGDFARGAYTISLSKGLRTEDGGSLPDNRAERVSVPLRSPQVSFATKGRYLPRSAWKKLAVRHRNVDAVDLTVRHVPRHNLVFWMTGDGERADARSADTLVRRTLPVSFEPDVQKTTWLDVRDLVPEAGAGVYELTVADGERSDATRLLVTDIQLVAKAASARPKEPYGRAIHAWALDAHSSAPMSGVKIEAVRASGKVLGSCETGGSGGCTVAVEPDEHDPSPPIALIAHKGYDLTYLRFADLRTEVAEAELHGEPYLDERAYRLAAWSDRDVFRPGETAHVAALLRDAEHAAPPAGMPVSAVLSDPRGNEVRSALLPTNPAGVVAWDLPFADFARTGPWTVTWTVADQVLATQPLHVEEFVPERMEVKASGPEAGVLAGEPVPIEVFARYLFGGSAEGSPVELSCDAIAAPFAPAARKEFTYGLWQRPDQAPKPVGLGSAAGELDAAGLASLPCPGLEAGLEGAGRVTARATVFEAGSGRSSQQTTTVRLHPERFYLGLQTGTRKAKAGQPFSVEGVVVDWQGELHRGVSEVEVELVRLEEEYGWLYDEEEDTERFRRYLREVPEGRSKASVADGAFRFDLTPASDAPAWLVRVGTGKARTELRVEGTPQRYWWWASGEDTVDQTPRPKRPGTIELGLPDRPVKVGEAVPVSFTVPYAGRALLTLETHDVLESEWRDVQPGPTTWTFQVDAFAPNVYASVLVIKDPHLDSKEAYVPDRSFGAASLRVAPEAYTLPLKVDTPEEIRPNSTLSVKIDAGKPAGPAFLTVAAVDEGILQLTDFETPDPLARIFARRALGVSTFETVGWSLLLPPTDTSGAAGGGVDGSGMGRVQMVKPVALWSGLVEVPSSGEVTVDLPVPTFRGKLRVMVVAADGVRMAAAERAVFVRDPLVLQATLPRFLSAGDVFRVPVFVTNTTASDQRVTVSLATSDLAVPGLRGSGEGEPPVRIRNLGEDVLSLAPGKSGTATFEGEALRSVGAARFRVEATAGSLSSFEELDVPLRPTGPRSRLVQTRELTAGTTDLLPLLGGWVPTTEQTTVRVTTNPYGEAFDHLSWLVRYPYGCVEQTTSSTRPLLWISRIVDDIDPTLTGGAPVEELVGHGLDRVLSMQTPDGGFAYWPGSTEPQAWATSYALHLLMEAREAGYEVPDSSVDRGVEWLARAVEARDDRYSWAEPYAHYVLAKGGQARKGRLRRLLEEAKADALGEQAERLYLLKAALWLAGDRRYEGELKNPDTSALSGERKNNARFYSDLRRRALTLSVFGDLFGDDPAGEPLARLVAGALASRTQYGLTTQEAAWAISGLGRRLKPVAGDFSAPELSIAGKTVRVEGKPENNERSWGLARASELGDLKLSLDKKGEGALYLVLSSEGIRQNATWEAEDRGIAVRRGFLDASGRALSGAPAAELGDLFYGVVALRNQTGGPVANLAVVDRLPAGWELENPRLGRDSLPGDAGDAPLWEPESMNLRDDRLELFGALAAGEAKVFVYAVRAVTSGRFDLPPIEAEAMYDPNVRSRSLGGPVVVQGPYDATAAPETGE